MDCILQKGNYLTYNMRDQYILAHVFKLAFGYGTPTVFSGYSFGNPDQGAPDGGYAHCDGNGPTGNWQCQHRWTPMVGMIGFYNKVGTQGMKNWVKGNNNQIAFSRGKHAAFLRLASAMLNDCRLVGAVGWVAINNETKSWKKTFTTGLPDGKYCNVVAGAKSGKTCTGGT